MCFVDVRKAMHVKDLNASDSWEHQSLPQVQLREMEKPSYDQCVNVDSVYHLGYGTLGMPVGVVSITLRWNNPS